MKSRMFFAETVAAGLFLAGCTSNSAQQAHDPTTAPAVTSSPVIGPVIAPETSATQVQPDERLTHCAQKILKLELGVFTPIELSKPQLGDIAGNATVNQDGSVTFILGTITNLQPNGDSHLEVPSGFPETVDPLSDANQPIALTNKQSGVRVAALAPQPTDEPYTAYIQDIYCRP